MNKMQYGVTGQEFRTSVLKINPLEESVKQEEERSQNMFSGSAKRNQKGLSDIAGLASGGCIMFTVWIALVLGIVAAAEYVGALVACGIWNHMIVPAFHLDKTITLFQGFVIFFVLQWVGGFFAARGEKSSVE